MATTLETIRAIVIFAYPTPGTDTPRALAPFLLSPNNPVLGRQW